jgi:hypothetical protein
MRKIKLFISTMLVFFCFQFSDLQAQQDISGFLNTSINDLTVLIENYAAPFIKGEGHAVANGWYNTAKTHNLFGFDLTVTINSALLPESERFFEFLPAQYQFIDLVPGQSIRIPTAVAADRPGPLLQDFTGTIAFNTPSGLGLPQWQGRTLAYMPIAQIGVGLIGGTDLKLRYWPEISIGKSTNSARGIALMHEVGQWIPFFERLNLNGSLLVGYTRLRSNYDFSPDNLGLLTQHSVFRIRSYTTQFILSREFSIVTLFIGGGFNFIESDLSYEGVFELNVPGGEVYQGIVDPILITLNYNAPQVTFGGSLKLAIFSIHAAYSITEYPVGTVGVSLGIN